jgi:hypothetical protein
MWYPYCGPGAYLIYCEYDGYYVRAPGSGRVAAGPFAEDGLAETWIDAKMAS